MKLEYRLSKQKENPKNIWVMPISWMSGDADHYEKINHKFKSEEAFIKAYEFIKKAILIRDKYHNPFCDIYANGFTSKVRFLEYLDSNAINEIKSFMEGFEYISELFESYGIESQYDAIYGGCARPEFIYDNKPYYYDSEGIKFDIGFIED